MEPTSVVLVGKLAIVFAALLLSLRAGLKLTKSMLITIVATIVLYAIPLKDTIKIWYKASTSFNTISLVLILYLITLLQRILQNRKQLSQVHTNLDSLFNSRRITATVAPIFIGLLPSAAAMLICGEIVRDTVGDALDQEEQAFITSYFRHIPESFLPTYAAVILMSELSGVSIGTFVLGMLPLEVLLYILGYWAYIRRIPKDTGLPPSENRGRVAVELLKNLWSIIAIIVLVIGFKWSVLSATLAVIIVCLPVYRYKPREILPLLKDAVEAPMLVNTYLIMVFKDFIMHSGAMDALPDFFSHLPVPTYLVFALIFFFGTVVAGAQAIIAICAVMAFAAIPGGGMPLMVLLMSFAYAAMQISPTHICLFIAADDFDVPMMALVRKTMPIIIVFCLLTVPYYWLLTAFF
ncbi:MAG: DUF401 family protein [Anaerovoracaceae bacterium]|jgi:integral membrane protein (TIGR00529 family)